MTLKKIEKVSVMHRKEIQWLTWYFKRDTDNPRFSQLDRLIDTARVQHNQREIKQYTTIKRVTEDIIRLTDKPLIELVKAVYVNRFLNVEVASQEFLFVSTSLAYKMLNEWFDLYFSLVFDYINQELLERP